MAAGDDLVGGVSLAGVVPLLVVGHEFVESGQAVLLDGVEGPDLLDISEGRWLGLSAVNAAFEEVGVAHVGDPAAL